jgi:hypothetical protein
VNHGQSATQPVPKLMGGQGRNTARGLVGVALGAFSVIVVAGALQPYDCNPEPAWLWRLVWSCVAIGVLAAFMAALAAGSRRGWPAAGSVIAGLASAALWFFVTFVVFLILVVPSGCFS